MSHVLVSVVWAHALWKKYHRNHLASVQCQGALQVATLYSTLSKPAIHVIAEAVAIHFLARECQVI